MTTYTTTEIATRVLKDLGLIAAEETPSDADLNWAIETVQAEILLMQADGINIWNGSDIEIPQYYLTVLSRRLGLPVGASFGMWSLAEVITAIPVAELALRKLGQIGPTGTPQQAEYF